MSTASTSFDTVLPADSVEFCPHPDATAYFACGTYKLEDSSSQESGGNQQRRGACLYFRVTAEKSEAPSLSKVDETPMAAILDMKWCHRSLASPATLGIADAEGNIHIHQMDSQALQDSDQGGPPSSRQIISPITVVPCSTSDVLCLSLDWSNRRFPSTDLGSLIVSLSNGSLCLLRPHTDGNISVQETWHAHDFEPWIVAWDYWHTDLVFSGGDDLKLKGWDCRQGFSQPTFTSKFTSGVTTIQSHPYIENVIAVGSYDNSVRLFDIRNTSGPFSDIDVGGGAWRVKWHPSSLRKNDLLVACMHDGFKVVQYDLNSLSTMQPNVINRFDEHDSLAYGVDWSFAPSSPETLIASCSFYDHTLRLWRG